MTDHIENFVAFVCENKSVIFSSPELKNDLFSSKLFEAAKNKFSREGYLYITTRIHKYFKALEVIRQKNNNLYKACVAESESYENPGLLLENQLITSFALAISAYERYTQSAFSEAESHLKIAITLDEKLENEGFEILHFHKIQLMHNFSRIYQKTDHNRCAAILLDLTALLSNVSDLYFQEFSIQYKKNRISTGLTNAMFTQIVSDLLIIYLKEMDNDNMDALSDIMGPFLAVLIDAPQSLLILRGEIISFSGITKHLFEVASLHDLENISSKISEFLSLEDKNLFMFKVFILVLYYHWLCKYNNDNTDQLKILLAEVFDNNPHIGLVKLKYLITNKKPSQHHLA